MPLIRITNDDRVETKEKKYDVLPEGYYEVYVESYTEPEVMEDIEKASIVFRVRDDIEQEGTGRKIWENINTNPNIAWKLSNIARAAEVPAGTDFDSLEAYLAALQGSSMKVAVKHREYNGKTYANITGFFPTTLQPYATDSEEDLVI